MLAIVLAAALQTAGMNACRLTDDDLIANRTLSFREFDQAGAKQPTTAGNLTLAKCFAEAALAQEDYLLNGPTLSEYERVMVRWRMALNIATTGREQEALPLVAASVWSAPPAADTFAWNAYVRGVWAFLAKDRPLLDASRAALRQSSGERNLRNLQALDRLSRCFGKSYAEASRSAACGRP